MKKEDLNNIVIEDYIPHRGRMKLIDTVIEADENITVTESVVRANWPADCNGSISPIVLIELVAQTLSFANGWAERNSNKDGGKGWLVGVKKARFNTGEILMGDRLITSVKKQHSHTDLYVSVTGTVSSGSQLLGEISVQAFRTPESAPA